MEERRHKQRHRTLISGKIVFNNKQSVIDCVVRNLSPSGACLLVNSSNGIPKAFDLLIDADSESRSCRVVWVTDTRVGIEFDARQAANDPQGGFASAPLLPTIDSARGTELVRNELLAVRAALDLVPVGIVLLDANTRAQFINRAFRRMWRLSDEKAESQPPFVALMYHGRDTLAYAVPGNELDAYVAERLEHVKSGNPKSLDLRLANGEVIRLQCTVLPSGGRMLCYTYVTDIVHRADELGMLRDALNQMQQGIILLDEYLNAQFMNCAVRQLWGVSDEQAERKPPYVELVNDSRKTGAYGVTPANLEKFIEERIATVRAGDPTPMDLRHRDGRIIRSHCTVLPGGGRMLTYNDVTDLISRAEQFEQLATIDGMTGLYNRRHFEVLAASEMNRVQRYNRPLSLIVLDIDEFKQTDDRFGHEAGDAALKTLATVCMAAKRSTDIVARLGGDEFVILLPETDLEEALILARRIQKTTNQNDTKHLSCPGGIAVSIGVAQASASMSGFEALLRSADKALYEAKAAGRNCIRIYRRYESVDNRAAAE